MRDQFSVSGQAATMSVNGLTCTLNMPEALKSQRGGDGLEITHALPPHAPRAAFRVAEYDHACPESWVRGDNDEASYFVPVQPEHGLWLDFNGNRGHTHHVAVLISVQGVNPITGRPVSDDKLEQYRKNCPVHHRKLGEDRFCKTCNFKWDAQNYLAGNATPQGYLWLDGFRAADGVVRQYVFTEEMARGVAAQILGDERVFAIGIAFYLSKQPKPPEPPRASLMLASYDYSSPPFIGYAAKGHSHRTLRSSRLVVGSQAEPVFSASLERSLSSPAKALEIAAGAKIAQRIHQDPEKLDFWQDEPAGRIYINYTDVATARMILESGKVDLTAGGEGFLQGLEVGQK